MAETVLIVDDNPVNRTVLANILKGEYETLQAADGAEALEVIRQQTSALSAILLDLIMPGMDGYAFLEALGREFPRAGIPVIVVTGATGAEVRALDLGATDFLGKPYRPRVILARLKNILQLRENAARLHRVERDSLTGLYNQEGFYQRVETLLHREPEMEVDIVAVDISNFKLVNALYGVNVGDEVLRQTARRLQKHFGCDILARRTADQFLMAFPGGGISGEELWRQIREWTNPLGLSLPVRLGICAARGTAVPVSILCDNAKIAADSIWNRYDCHWALYDDAVRTRLETEQQLADDLETGLRTGQLEAWYQPKCDPATGKVVGAEALVRWNHPTRGSLSPDAFVPLFERNHLILKLDRFMWERTCRDLAAWQQAGHPAVPVSVNVSRVDVYQRDLAEQLGELLDRLGIPRNMLPLEITESAYCDDPAQLNDTIRRLRQAGFLVEMDDFGSGWSSLNALTELPVDGVKLDRKFLRDLETERGERFVRHLVEMIGDLGIPMTAEGVESARQASFLRELGCRSAQGLYYAPPMPRERFEAYLLEHL